MVFKSTPARSIESYFNTLPPLNFSFKEKIEEEIVSDIWSNE